MNLPLDGLPLNRAAIEAILPHRDPMLLIDEVVELVPGERVVARKTVTEEDCAGHFPGNPILPGVLTCEAIAQAAAAHTSLSAGLKAQTASYLFMGLEKVRFRTPITPGDTIRIRVEKVRDKLDIYEFTGTAHVGDKLAASSTFTAKLIRK